MTLARSALVTNLALTTLCGQSLLGNTRSWPWRSVEVQHVGSSLWAKRYSRISTGHLLRIFPRTTSSAKLPLICPSHPQRQNYKDRDLQQPLSNGILGQMTHRSLGLPAPTR